MKYKGKELVEMTPEKWDGKSREMIVWCDDVSDPVHYGNICYIKNVIGYNPRKCAWVVDDKRLDYWPKCAEIPKEELKIEIKPKYDFVENLLKAAQEQNDCITIPKR